MDDEYFFSKKTKNVDNEDDERRPKRITFTFAHPTHNSFVCNRCINLAYLGVRSADPKSCAQCQAIVSYHRNQALGHVKAADRALRRAEAKLKRFKKRAEGGLILLQ
mmetsp:Transcript_28757/g.55914  ORF Transcript_28757/g.55914 Transcript_28757/m.55914 type:complete len:107 (+) Transcript_28757:719-1039(+)